MIQGASCSVVLKEFVCCADVCTSATYACNAVGSTAGTCVPFTKIPGAECAQTGPAVTAGKRNLNITAQPNNTSLQLICVSVVIPLHV